MVLPLVLARLTRVPQATADQPDDSATYGWQIPVGLGDGGDRDIRLSLFNSLAWESSRGGGWGWGDGQDSKNSKREVSNEQVIFKHPLAIYAK